MIFKILLLAGTILSYTNLFCQYTNSQNVYLKKIELDSLNSKILSLTELVSQDGSGETNFSEKCELIKSIKEYSDHYYYVNLWEQYKTESDHEKRITLLQNINQYKYYFVSDLDLNDIARKLYRESHKALIYEYEGNLEMLKLIETVPAYHRDVYPFLKRAIIAAGGKWERY